MDRKNTLTQVLSFRCITLQIYGDPEAADIVFTSGADVDVVGINITTQVCFTGLFLDSVICMVRVQLWGQLYSSSKICFFQMRISWS